MKLKKELNGWHGAVFATVLIVGFACIMAVASDGKMFSTEENPKGNSDDAIREQLKAPPNDSGWERNYAPKTEQPVALPGLSPEAFAKLKTVKVIHEYRVNDTIGGIAYYDEKTNMICHVTTGSTMIDVHGISCAPYTRVSK